MVDAAGDPLAPNPTFGVPSSALLKLFHHELRFLGGPTVPGGDLSTEREAGARLVAHLLTTRRDRGTGARSRRSASN